MNPFFRFFAAKNLYSALLMTIAHCISQRGAEGELTRFPWRDR